MFRSDSHGAWLSSLGADLPLLVQIDYISLPLLVEIDYLIILLVEIDNVFALAGTD